MERTISTNNKGFSLVELIVVIAIMAVLVAVLAPSLIGYIEESRESSDIQLIDGICTTITTANLLEGESSDGPVAINALDATSHATAIDALTDAYGANYATDLVPECTCGTNDPMTIFIDYDADECTVFVSDDNGSSAFAGTENGQTLSVTK